jgi:hypothetical protein
MAYTQVFISIPSPHHIHHHQPSILPLLLQFVGNTYTPYEPDTKVTNWLYPAVRGRYIRLSVQAWNGWISIRFGLIGCDVTI